MTPGVATLFQGGKAAAKGKQPNTAAGRGGNEEQAATLPPKVRRTVKISLIAGDAAILGLVAWLLLGSGKPLTSIEILISVLAVVLGAWLTCLALFLD